MPEPQERALLESIRSGQASSNVKRQASRGVFPVSADELLEILVILTGDSDPTMSEEAKKTLGGWTTEKVAPLLAQPDCSAEVLAWFAAQTHPSETLVAVIAAHPNADDAALAPLAPLLSLEQLQHITATDERLDLLPAFITAALQRRDLPADLRARLQLCHDQHAAAQAVLAEALAREEEAEAKAPEVEKRERISLTQKIARMNVSERMSAALKGDKDMRMVLVRDPAKVVFRAVLQSPKLSEAEVENFATMKNVSDEVLRIIATSRKFMKNYVITRNLLNNPKTPLDVSLTLLNRMTNSDLNYLTKNRNIPETLRNMALRLFKQRSETRSP
ncbi:MAG: hypothetical protein ACRD5I_08930 [Candidatus Acidiferrales bacterium]